MKRIFVSFFLISALTFLLPGCASTRTTRTESVVTETTVTDQSIKENKGNFPQGSSGVEEEGTSRTVEKTTEEKEEKVAGESRGILGTTIHFIGQVLAFPFKIIAGVIEAIF